MINKSIPLKNKRRRTFHLLIQFLSIYIKTSCQTNYLKYLIHPFYLHDDQNRSTWTLSIMCHNVFKTTYYLQNIY